MTNPINPKTGKPYSNQTMWIHKHPELVNTLCTPCHKIQHIKDFARWHKCKIEADKQLNNMITS
jgi:hypothetical protein